MKKTLIIFKTHFLEDYVIQEYNKITAGVGKNCDCILFTDNHKQWLNTPNKEAVCNINYNNNQTVKSFIYDENIHKELKLPQNNAEGYTDDLGEVLWYNSDYPFYFIRKHFPDYSFYWSFEYDVFFNGKNYQPFFDKYNNYNEDFLSVNCRNVNYENWYWKRGTDWAYNNVKDLYGCIFPVVRLSDDAIDYLYNKRLEYGQLYNELQSKNDANWLFCEIFTPTELINKGFSYRNIIEENVRYLPIYNLNTQRIFEKPDNKLYHPVK